ncbi:Aquaporin-3 [Apophysomyces sp. BC1034]|nr:Aquaporin-3 [Apophysomyces sp. BC1015]KAG0175951.1 Aquaporin-3 [Apophysomyces sp. BC1021]KAG0185943.1 Aquaporin-3 [Apophysomyces sp. BC1034]
MSSDTILGSPQLEAVTVVKRESSSYSYGGSAVTDDKRLEISSTSTGLKKYYHRLLACLRRSRHKFREPLAEFLGTLVLILLINGIMAYQILIAPNNMSWLTVSLGSGFAVLCAIALSGHVSGAHVNPVITLVFCLYGDFPGHKVPIYWLAQFFGGFCGSAILYVLVLPAIDHFDGGSRTILGKTGTAGIFATYPPPYVGLVSATVSEIVGTGMLVLLILSTGHPNNVPFSYVQGVMVAVGLVTIILAFGYTSGFSLNPARDLGPRLFTAIAGWGIDVFTINDYYVFVPLLAPFVGGIFGGAVYSIFIDS